jgi:putative ABC transport system permease protein
LWGTDVLVRLAPQELARLDEVRVDARILLAGSLLTLVVGTGFGLWPAWRASRHTLGATLNSVARGSVGRERRRAQRWLVAAELALALVLVAGAGLLITSFSRLLTVRSGFDPAGIVAADVSLPSARYADPDRKSRFHEAVLEQLRAAPGVQDVAMGLVAPVSFEINRGVWIEGQPEPPPGELSSMAFVT